MQFPPAIPRMTARACRSTGLTVRVFSGSLTASLAAVGLLSAITGAIATVLAGGRSFWRSNSRIVLCHSVLLMLGAPECHSTRTHGGVQKGADLAAHVPNSIARQDPASGGENSRQLMNGVHLVEVAPSTFIVPSRHWRLRADLTNGRAIVNASARMPTST